MSGNSHKATTSIWRINTLLYSLHYHKQGEITMKKTTNELHTQSALIFQEVQSISRYTSLIKAIDDNIYELACSPMMP